MSTQKSCNQNFTHSCQSQSLSTLYKYTRYMANKRAFERSASRIYDYRKAVEERNANRGLQ